MEHVLKQRSKFMKQVMDQVLKINRFYIEIFNLIMRFFSFFISNNRAEWEMSVCKLIFTSCQYFKRRHLSYNCVRDTHTSTHYNLAFHMFLMKIIHKKYSKMIVSHVMLFFLSVIFAQTIFSM